MQQLSICLAALLPCFSDLAKPLFIAPIKWSLAPSTSSLTLFLRDSSSSSLAADHSGFHTCYSHLWLHIQNSSSMLHTTKTLVYFCSFHFHSCFSFVFFLVFYFFLLYVSSFLFFYPSVCPFLSIYPSSSFLLHIISLLPLYCSRV